MNVKCYNCQSDLDITANQDLGRSEECPKCFASLRCCKMCQFYNESAYNECSEPVAERIVDKEKANFCDYFKTGSQSNNNETSKQSALDAANALFKK